jgi:integrase/recombinase XerD
MKQAKVLNDGEMKRLLAVIAQRKHAARDRAALMLSFYAGLRVGEIAALTMGDVLDAQGRIRDRILLRAEITKGGQARVVFPSDRLHQELQRYVDGMHPARRASGAPLLLTQKRTQFSANTLCQLFAVLYRAAGIDGASSHSGRRWFITRLAHSAVSPKVIMTLAGHKSLATTQRYIEVNDAMMRAAVAILD